MNTRLAVASTLGSRCALDMLESCDVAATDSDGAYLVHVADPLPGDFEALEGKIGDPTDEERAAFVESYRIAVADAIAESGRDDEDDEEDEDEDDEPAYVVWGVRASRIHAIRTAETDWSDLPDRTWLDALSGSDADEAWCVCVTGIEEEELDADSAVEGWRRY